jgi:transcriptional regulator with XRE-family HTH domain
MSRKDTSPVGLLESLRVDRGLTVEQAAERTGLAPRTIRRYERALVHPVGDRLERLARLYGGGVRASELLADIRSRMAEREQRDAVAA